jgi:RNA polymerase sigma factor (sigma-70 family)
MFQLSAEAAFPYYCGSEPNLSRNVPVEEKLNDFIPTRESLLSRLKDLEDQAAWQDFFQIYRKLIYSMAIRARLTEQEAEEVVQETLISVANTMEKFKYDPTRCRFKSWLGHLTRNHIAACYRKRARDKAQPLPDNSSTGTAAVDRLPEPQSLDTDHVWEEEWRKQLLAAALERVKRLVSPDQFQLFDFYVLKEVPVFQVARTLDVSVGQVYLAKHRISKLLKKEVKRLEAEMA